MMIIGPISSIYDFLTVGILLWVFHASTNAPLFHTGYTPIGAMLRSFRCRARCWERSQPSR